MRRLRRAIVMLLATIIVIVGCTAHKCPVPPRLAGVAGRPVVDVKVYVGPEFSEREKANIVNGILMWERATNGLVVWHMLAYDPAHPPKVETGTKSHDGIEERTVLFRRAVSTDDWVVKWDKDNKKTLLGLCQGNSVKELAWLWLVENRLTSPASETIIAAHEFGHAIGLDHIEHKQSVMSEFYNTATQCLTAEDLKEFCKKHGCDATLTTPVCRE